MPRRRFCSGRLAWAAPLLFAMLAMSRPAAAADDPAPPPPERHGWLYILPVVAYSPETKVALGGSVGRFYRFSDDPEARPTTTTPLALFTTNGQIILGLFTDAWLDDNRWHLVSNLGFSKFPTQFYGVGENLPESAEEDYTPSTTTLLLEAKRRMSGAFYLGGIVDVRHASIADIEAGGLLDTGGFYGADGGTSMGLGVSAAWDTRDAVFYPTRGWWNRVAVTRYLDVLGGDHVYTWLDAGVARYWSLGGSRVLAARVSGSFISGGRAPFSNLNRLMLRGYFEERHLDNHVVRAQLEYRTPLRGRFGGVVFAGVGDLARTTDGLRLDDALPVGGFGLRFNVRGDDETANLRLDLGFGDGDRGVYIRFGEAF